MRSDRFTLRAFFCISTTANSWRSQNSDVFKGVVSWAAGGFDTSYVITETPNINGTTLTDQPLVSQCIVAKFRGASGVL